MKSILVLFLAYILPIQLVANTLGEQRTQNYQVMSDVIADEYIGRFTNSVSNFNHSNFTMESLVKVIAVESRNQKSLTIRSRLKAKMPLIKEANGIASFMIDGSEIRLSPIGLYLKQVEIDGQIIQFSQYDFESIYEAIAKNHRTIKSSSFTSLILSDAQAWSAAGIIAVACVLLYFAKDFFLLGSVILNQQDIKTINELLTRATTEAETLLARCHGGLISTDNFMAPVSSLFNNDIRKRLANIIANRGNNAVSCSDAVRDMLQIPQGIWATVGKSNNNVGKFCHQVDNMRACITEKFNSSRRIGDDPILDLIIDSGVNNSAVTPQ